VEPEGHDAPHLTAVGRAARALTDHPQPAERPDRLGQLPMQRRLVRTHQAFGLPLPSADQPLQPLMLATWFLLHPSLLMHARPSPRPRPIVRRSNEPTGATTFCSREQ